MNFLATTGKVFPTSKILISHPVLNPHLLLSLPSHLSQFLMADCQLLMGTMSYRLNPEEYVNAALLIYLDIVLIFLCLLGRRWKLSAQPHTLTHTDRHSKLYPQCKCPLLLSSPLYVETASYFKWHDRIMSLSIVPCMSINMYIKNHCTVFFIVLHCILTHKVRWII